ncbi:MAG: hypothetical protein EAX96_05820, partial [Candidatus Lokiarchaeota archaeon]|nr:hypothetical protein [Candidatus Lokiarchaeota archaeon]
FKYTNITSIYVDNSNPIIYVSEPSVSVVTGILWLNGTVDGTGSPLTLYCNDSKFDVAINPNGSIYNTYSLFNNSIIPDGLITINLTVMDMAGFKYTNITSIYVDNSIPNIGITSITNGSVKFGNIVWINGTVNATGSIISSLTINDTDNFEVVLNPIGQETGTFAIRNKSPLSDGKFALKITVTDLANLQNDTNLYFYIDNLVNLNPIIQLTNPSINGSVLVVNSSNYLVLEGNVQGVSNNTELVWINQSGWILEINPSGTPGGPFRFRNASTFPDGLYWINITVNNTDGNSTSLLLSFYIDTIAPPTPGNLQGTVSGNNVTLTWDNVTDLTNFSFVIYRNGQQIATTTALSYTDVGLSPGTYTYLVYVVDDAGNICAVAASKTVSISSGEAPPQTIDWMLIIIIIVIVGASIAAGIGIFIAVKRKSRRTEPEKVPKLKKEEIKKDKVTPKKVERDEKAGKSEEISVLREYDYVGGEIRFKVAVRNESPGTISKLNVILSSTEQYLVDEKMKTIEVLTPGESRGVDFNLTPLTCGKSRIFATLSYADSTGEPKSLTVSPKDIWIKCPLVTPKETSISQVMVWKKELLNGSSMVEYSNVPDTQAFKIALDQVSALDLFEVTRNEHDKTATFSGVAKVTDTKMIIEVSIHSQKIHLNVWTGDMKQATGFLAYIKNLIKMSLETAKNIEMKAEAISQMIFDSIEICNRIIALLDLCKKRENVGDILLIIGEIITRLTRSFPDIPFLENAGEWKQSISTNLRPGDNIPRNYSIRLQSDSLIWFQKILELAKSNSELFETTFRDHHSQILQIKSKIVELAERYLWEEKRYSMSIVKYMMIINKESGVTMYQRSFFETKLDPDLISGFLTAIQSFGLELSTEESSMKKLVYRDFQIELEDGDYVRAALIMEGEVTQFLMRSLLKFVNRFERTFAEHLENWDGRLQQFEDADKIVDEEFEIERPPK